MGIGVFLYLFDESKLETFSWIFNLNILKYYVSRFYAFFYDLSQMILVDCTLVSVAYFVYTTNALFCKKKVKNLRQI